MSPDVTLDEMRVRGAGPAAGIIGKLLLAEHTDRLAAHLAKVMLERPTPRKRKPMSLTPEVFDALQGIPKATMAAAMLRGCIDAQGILGQKAPPQVKVKIGLALELQARGVAVYKALTARDWKRLNRIAARKLSLRKKRQAEYAILRDRGIAIEPWPRELTGLVGAFACDMLLTALPDVCVEENTIARISKEAAEAIEAEHLALPANEPTATPPHPWFAYDGVDGETFVQACRDVPAVRAAIRRGIPHVDAVNYLQSIPFSVNEHVLNIVKQRKLLKKIKKTRDGELCDPAVETLLEANIDLADRFRGQPFYVPARVDFRGRLVTGTTLNFTGPDHIRGLFQFAEGAPITERGIEWLKIACATAFNEWKEVSRWKFEDRLRWTEDNLDRICAAGRGPLEHEAWLDTAGDPIQCVALFHELANAVDVGPSYICTVPIGFDATCSGLQHYALLARDHLTARFTNLVPSDDPKDIYDRILRPVQVQLAVRANAGDEEAAWWLGDLRTPGRIDRKVIKGLVMTYCYSSVPWGQANQVCDTLRDQGIDIPAGAPKNLVELVRRAIERHIRSAPTIMKQLQALVGKSNPVCWVSPSGLPVSNSYPKPRIKRVRHYLHDKSVRCVQSVEWKPEQGFGKARSSIAPNYIHSLDSAHLALVACACERQGIPLVTVHDSYSTLPRYADRLREILLEELRNMYAGYVPLVRPSGDLDLNEVTGEYAFS
jgi:DNA-dependent RNA polymerase